jgi:hypothetical protein
MAAEPPSLLFPMEFKATVREMVTGESDTGESMNISAQGTIWSTPEYEKTQFAVTVSLSEQPDATYFGTGVADFRLNITTSFRSIDNPLECRRKIGSGNRLNLWDPAIAAQATYSGSGFVGVTLSDIFLVFQSDKQTVMYYQDSFNGDPVALTSTTTDGSSPSSIALFYNDVQAGPQELRNLQVIGTTHPGCTLNRACMCVTYGLLLLPYTIYHVGRT